MQSFFYEKNNFYLRHAFCFSSLDMQEPNGVIPNTRVFPYPVNGALNELSFLGLIILASINLLHSRFVFVSPLKTFLDGAKQSFLS